MGRPSDSVRSTSRHRNAWSSTRVPGYHLNGIVTSSASCPRSPSASTRSSAISSAPPRTNGTWGAQTATLMSPSAPRAGPAVGGASSGFEALDALVEVVDQLQHRVVERALIGECGLDVPPHETAQERLHRAALPHDRPFGRDGPQALSLVADREA